VLAWLVSAANRLASEICFYGDCVHGSVHVVTNRLSYVVCVHVVAIKLRYAQGFHSQLLQLHSNPSVEHSRAPWLHALSRRASLRFMCPILLCLPLCYLEGTISCQSMEERIAQSSHLITYWDDESTPNPINIERKVTQQLCSSAGLVQIRFYNEGRRKLAINMPCRSCVEVLRPASERLETIIAPHNWIDAATAFAKTNVRNIRTYSWSLRSNPRFLWASSCLCESAEDKSDAAARRASSADS
jgi:hypothetical protein